MSRICIALRGSLTVLAMAILISGLTGCKKKKAAATSGPPSVENKQPQNAPAGVEKKALPSPFAKEDPSDDRDLGSMTLSMDGSSKTLGAHSVYSRSADRQGDLINIEGKDGSVYGLIDLNEDGRIEKDERWDGVDFTEFSNRFVGKKMKVHRARGALIVLKDKEMCPIMEGWVKFTEVKGGPKQDDEHSWKGEMELTISTRAGQKKVNVTFDCKFIIL